MIELVSIESHREIYTRIPQTRKPKNILKKYCGLLKKNGFFWFWNFFWVFFRRFSQIFINCFFFFFSRVCLKIKKKKKSFNRGYLNPMTCPYFRPLRLRYYQFTILPMKSFANQINTPPETSGKLCVRLEWWTRLHDTWQTIVWIRVDLGPSTI